MVPVRDPSVSEDTTDHHVHEPATALRRVIFAHAAHALPFLAAPMSPGESVTQTAFGAPLACPQL